MKGRKVALAQINPTTGDLKGNLEKVVNSIREAKAEIAGEVDEGFQLGAEGNRGGEYGPEELAAGLNGTLRPATLLALEGVDVLGKLCRNLDVRKKDKAPPLELGAVGEIQILGQGVMLPSPGILYGFSFPHSGGAVEVEETATAAADLVLHQEMAV